MSDKSRFRSGRVQDKLYLKDFYNTTTSIPAQQVKDTDFDMSWNGYRFICVGGFMVGSGGMCSVVSCYKRSDNQVRMRVINNHASVTQTPELVVQGLFEKI